MNIKLNKLNKLENDKFANAKEKIYNELIKDMEDNSLDLQISQENIDLANKRYKNIKIKKNILFLSIISFFIVLNICSIYKTFFKHELTGYEIASISNYYNNKTNFPESGVQAFLKENLEFLLTDKINYNKDVKDIKFGIPIITRINSKNNFISNVYFYLDANTNFGNDKFSCMISLYYDYDLNKYYSCGDILITPLSTAVDSLDKKENPLMSFKGKKRINENDSDSAEIFITNFFTMFYSNQDISPYYKGKTLDNGKLKFISIKNFEMYLEPNKNGYNVKCEIALSSSLGFTFETIKYLFISKTGDSWIITGVL